MSQISLKTGLKYDWPSIKGIMGNKVSVSWIMRRCGNERPYEVLVKALEGMRADITGCLERANMEGSLEGNINAVLLSCFFMIFRVASELASWNWGKGVSFATPTIALMDLPSWDPARKHWPAETVPKHHDFPSFSLTSYRHTPA